MSMILLAVEDAVRDAPVRDLLTAEGWWVTTVVSQEEALRAAADHAPQLLIVDAGLAAPGPLLRAFARQEGGPGVLVLLDSEGDAVPEESDGVVWRDQSPSEILAVVRHTLHAPRTALEHAPAPSETTSEDEQLTTSELFGDILETLDDEVTHPPDLAPTEPGTEVVHEPDVEEPAPEPGPESEPEPEFVPEPDEVEVEEPTVAEEVAEPAPEEAEEVAPEEPVEPEPEPELAEEPEFVPEPDEVEIEEPAVAEEEPEPAPEGAEEVAWEEPVEPEPEPELVEESEFVPEPDEVEIEEPAVAEEESEPEPEGIEEPAPEQSVEPEPEPELVEEPEVVPEPDEVEIEQPAAESVPETAEEPEAEVEVEILEPAVEDEDGLESGVTTGAEETDWLIERVLDEDSPAEGGPDGDGADEPQPTLLAPEHSTDIEAAVDGLLAAEDLSWQDSGSETDEIDRLVIDEVLAGDGAGDGESSVVDAELEGNDEDLERLGPYKLFEILEYGELTERWLAARSDGAQDKIVVERIRPELQSRADVRQAFVDGYSEAAGWDQKNLLKVVDLGRDGDIDYVATEFHAGHSLREVLSRIRRMEARMPLGIGLLLAERIVAGLQELGGGPLSSRHGWLVPSSVWLTEDGEVLLREFGFGRLGPVEDVPPRDWTEYRFVGPDFWGGQPDLRADLYSLGALLYETIGGKPTHDAADPETLMEKVREDSIAPSQVIDPTIPSEVDGWIMRLLRRNPGERPQAVEEISAKVDLALQSLPARPSNAELAAYLRQLFAARVPDLSVEQSQHQALPAPVATGGDEDQDEVKASPWRSFAGRPWTWWLVVAVLALVLAFFAWRLAAADEPATAPSPESRLAPPPAPPPAPAVRPAR